MDASKKPSVLVVDDDRSILELLKSILRREDYQVVGEATNGLDAIKKAVDLKPDIILLDIQMPKMDGLESLEAIHKANPAAMVLMVSASSTIERVKEALQKGAAGFVVKPFKPASVLDTIGACWKKRNSHDNNKPA